jgi:hypothetical protein
MRVVTGFTRDKRAPVQAKLTQPTRRRQPPNACRYCSPASVMGTRRERK